MGSPAAEDSAPRSDDPARPSQRVPYPVTPHITCGGQLAFPRKALRNPRGYERLGTEPARALRSFLRTNADDIGQPRSGWFLLALTEQHFEVASGRLPELGHMAFERGDGAWAWVNSGGCIPSASRNGLEASGWTRRSRRRPVARDATRIAVHVHENDCASGRPATRRVLPPLVHYGRRAITVTYFIRPPTGGQNCPSNPPTPATLRLDEPVGDRVLRDGAPLRPRRVR